MTSEILTMHIVDETEGVFTPTGGRYYVSFRFFPSELNSGSAKEFKDRSITPALLALANQRKIDNTTQHNTTQHNTTQHNTTQHNTTQHNQKEGRRKNT